VPSRQFWRSTASHRPRTRSRWVSANIRDGILAPIEVQQTCPVIQLGQTVGQALTDPWIAVVGLTC
jgi:hypothetical protein